MINYIYIIHSNKSYPKMVNIWFAINFRRNFEFHVLNFIIKYGDSIGESNCATRIQNSIVFVCTSIQNTPPNSIYYDFSQIIELGSLLGPLEVRRPILENHLMTISHLIPKLSMHSIHSIAKC
jgi:hypothetical protein